MRILICTIIRNREPFLAKWQKQILSLQAKNPGITFDLSVFENDSTDASPVYLAENETTFKQHLNNVWITSVVNHWPYFASIKAEERVCYLAKARNSCLGQVTDLSLYDKVLFIEPDIQYNAAQLSRLFDTNDDIASPYSLHPMNVQSHRWIYDSWATRIKTCDQSFQGPCIFDMPFRIEVAATFNCFCVYNAKPFAEGARFSGINPLTKIWDCDTTNICYEFNLRGYKRIGLYNLPLIHLGN
jgi:hypothetical protein